MYFTRNTTVDTVAIPQLLCYGTRCTSLPKGNLAQGTKREITVGLHCKSSNNDMVGSTVHQGLVMFGYKQIWSPLPHTHGVGSSCEDLNMREALGTVSSWCYGADLGQSDGDAVRVSMATILICPQPLSLLPGALLHHDSRVCSKASVTP